MIFATPTLPAEYVEVIQKIDGLRTQLRYQTSDNRRSWTGLLRRSTFARGIQGSNSIEGYNVSEGDAVAAVDEEEPFDADADTWAAISGYRAALSYVLQLSDDPFYVHNEGTIRSLHYMMISYDTQKHPGRWRPGAVWVKHEPSGEVVYEGPDVQLVPGLMAELINSLNVSSDQPAMIRAAMAHLNLVMIHPFLDGNGRMARALQTMVLAREGILDPVFSSIEEYLGKYTLDYYAVLGEVGKGAWHPENSALPWIRFCLIAHYRQAETILRRVKEIERLWNLMEAELASLGLNSRMMNAVSDAAFGYKVRNSSYRKLADISDEVASKDLRTLVEKGFLTAQGERRGRYYIASPRLREVTMSVREKRVQTDPFVDGPAGSIAQPQLPGLFPNN